MSYHGSAAANTLISIPVVMRRDDDLSKKMNSEDGFQTDIHAYMQ